jgi:anti-sigma factor (TIGR02949 family)
MTHPHDHMDCREALDRLYEYLDGELTPERSEAMRAHLTCCAHCFAISDFEAAYRRFLAARARARGAPSELKRRVLERLLAEGDPPAIP